jgi:hypothetical protein
LRVIALIDDPAMVRCILEHPGRWAPERAGASARPALQSAGRRRNISPDLDFSNEQGGVLA